VGCGSKPVIGLVLLDLTDLLHTFYSQPTMKATSTRKRLSNVTWTLGQKPCKTLKLSSGSYCDQVSIRNKKAGKGKVGGIGAG
jgi:hypothetical protein